MVQTGTCWIRQDDHWMVEVTDVTDDAVSYIVVSPTDVEPDGIAPRDAFETNWTRLTDEQAEMRELYEQAGLSVRDIGERYGVSVYTAYYRLKNIGTQFRSSGVRKGQVYARTLEKDRKKAHIRQRLIEGWSVREAGEELGISMSHAYQLAREVRETQGEL